MPQDSSHPLQSRYRRYQQQRHGRQQDHVPCVLCGAQLALGLEVYTEHFQAAHGDILETELAAGGDATAIGRKYYRRSQNPPDPGQRPDETLSTPSKRASKSATILAKASADAPTTPASPSASGVSSTRAVLARGTSPSSQNNNHQARRAASASDASDFIRSHHPNRNPRVESTKRANRTSGPRLLQHPPQQHAQPGPKRHDEADGSVNTMLRQPDTRPISQQQLVAEVKGIYKGLVLVESKCIEVDAAQSAQTAQKDGEPIPELTDEQWQALGALHRALLHEHHDFFLASQHPCASPPLKRLASKYSMPARMWRHGIHSYLELLRHRLPKSREHMLSYIYLAYGMMVLLYETIPSYEETWIECLGDLGRYRMAIEDENNHDREIWTEVSRQWYKKASDLSPGTGRLYHHLAILARPNWLQQLLYYSKSLCVPNPFESARESILTLFEPLIMESGTHPYEMQQQPIDPPFVRCHACMFMRIGAEQQRSYAQKFLSLLDNHIARTARLFLQPAYTIGIANCCAMVEYGSKSNVIFRVINKEPDDVKQAEENSSESGDATSTESGNVQPTDEFFQARALACDTARVILDRLGDPNVWPFVHVTLVFVHHLTFFQSKGGMEHIERAFPWSPLVNLLNTLRSPSGADPKHESDTFPGLAEDGPPLPEDFAMRGLLWADKYHPAGWLAEAKVDNDEKGFELPSMAEQRRDRILWLGCRIAKFGRWIKYDGESRAFSVVPEFADVEAEPGGGGVMDVDSSGSEATVGAG
ncbi:hypothetical protein VUR80DRAFT_3152 [Thermomyces stellatus]